MPAVCVFAQLNAVALAASLPWDGLLAHGFPQLDLLQMYLLVINAATFFLNAVDQLLLRARGRGLHTMPLDVLAVMGGAAGAALAFCIWERRTVKENAWRHILTFDLLVIWLVVLGFVYVAPFSAGKVAGFARTMAFGEQSRDAAVDLVGMRVGPWSARVVLLVYLACVNVLTLVLFGVDKVRALQGDGRIPEAVLLAATVAGGSLGALLGMAAFRHKIRSPQFRYGVPLTLVAQLGALALAASAGLV